MKHKHSQVKSRNEPFAKRTATRIWEEQPSTDNPYIAAASRCYGYDIFELLEKRSFVDVFHLLFRGELPTCNDAQLLEALMIGLINPGPRHPATRAAMAAGVGKTDPVHILPISLSILGGSHLGGGEIEGAMRFLRKNLHSDPSELAEKMLAESEPPENGDWRIAPGFGNRFGGIDLMALSLAERLIKLPAAGKLLHWGSAFASAIGKAELGWLSTGVAAAVFAELGFQPRAGGGLFQLLGAPGLLAHGLELANKPFTAMPFISDDHYVIEK